MPDLSIEIDSSEVKREVDRLRNVTTPKQFESAMAGVMRRTGSHVKKILRDDIPQQYNVKPAEVSRAVKRANVTVGGGGAGCVVPVVDSRKHIGGGGRGYRAYSPYVYGWRAVSYGHYSISAQIYRGARSALPFNMPQTGFPPFRNMPKSKLGSLAAVRTGEKQKNDPKKKKDAIDIVMGPAIPQMPLNKSEPDVQRDIMFYLKGRVEHRIQALIAGGR